MNIKGKSVFYLLIVNKEKKKCFYCMKKKKYKKKFPGLKYKKMEILMPYHGKKKHLTNSLLGKCFFEFLYKILIFLEKSKDI